MNTFIVMYDIADEKRLRNIHRTMKGFGDAIQYSVFRCVLSPKNFQILLGRLQPLIKKDEDSVMIINLGPYEGLWKDRIKILGKKKDIEPEDKVFIF